MNKKERLFLLKAEEIVAVVAALLLITAAFLPWGSSANSEILGIEGSDSMMTIALGILALVTLLIKKVPNLIPLILGLLAFSVGINDYVAMAKITQALGGKVGYGLYLTLIGSLGVVLGSGIDIIRTWRRKSRT